MLAPSKNGAILVRTAPEMRKSLRNEAFRRGISLNQLCNQLLKTEKTVSPIASSTPEWNEAIQSLQRTFPDDLEGIVLFGSSARKENTEQSDVDLLLVMHPRVPITRDLYRKYDDTFHTVETSRTWSPHFVTLPDTSEEVGGLWFECAVDGIVLWDRIGSVTKLLQGLRGQMADQRIQRKWSHGHPYWVRDP